MAPRETENNAYEKFWADKQRALWYVMVFSGVSINADGQRNDRGVCSPDEYLMFSSVHYKRITLESWFTN